MKKTSYLLLFLLLLYPLLSSATFRISFANPYSVLKDNVPASLSNKKQMLSSFQKNARYYPAGNLSGGSAVYSCKSLINGSCVVAMDIDNTEEDWFDILISDLPDSWTVRVRRQAMVSDWYSSNMKLNYLTFIGDALPMLKADVSKRTWSLPVLRSEKARIIFEFTPKNAGQYKIRVKTTSRKAGTAKTATININVLAPAAPAGGFSSVIFNANNTQSGDPMIKMWQDIGLTHLQVNYVPAATFDAKGNIITKIDPQAAQSIGFRNTALPWIRQGKAVLLFWQSRYEKMAPLSGGTFLKPYTKEWMTAYKNLVTATYEYLKAQYPSLQKSQMVLYIADEVSSKKMSGNPSQEVKEINAFLQFLKTSLPDYKTFVTFGYYSYPADIDLIRSQVDILCPHFIMPESLGNKSAPAGYSPRKVFAEKFNAGKLRQQQNMWGYQVEKGKNSDIRQFRLLPLIAAAQEYEGLSWYAFCHTSGSSWIGNDGKILDYGLYYQQETRNPVYSFWTKNIDNTEKAIPSMRTLAAKAGLEDARIIRYLLEHQHKLSGASRSGFLSLVAELKQINTNKYPELEEIEALSERLKEIYSSVK